MEYVGIGGKAATVEAVSQSEIADAGFFHKQQSSLVFAEALAAAYHAFGGSVPASVRALVQQHVVVAEYEEAHHRSGGAGGGIAAHGGVQSVHRRIASGHKEQREQIHGQRHVGEEEAVGVVKVGVDIAGEIVPVLYRSEDYRQQQQYGRLI